VGLLLRKGREGKVRDGRGGEEKGEKGEMGEGRGGEGEGQSPHRKILDPPLSGAVEFAELSVVRDKKLGI